MQEIGHAMERKATKLVTVFGGSGFVGRYLVRALAKSGWRVRVAVRRPDLVGHLQPMGGVGQIKPVFANVRHVDSVRAAVAHADVVVNLVGILAEGGKQSFEGVQAEGARNIADAAAASGATRLIQMSALGADAESESVYARTKAAGERSAHEAMAGQAITIRPSILFGPEDQFFNRFAGMAKRMPFVPVISPDTRFQPVYVGDVAAFTAAAVEGRIPAGTTYELGGPEIRTFRELMEQMLEVTRQKRRVVAMPEGIARLQAKALSILPNPPITEDQITMLGHDNVVSDAAISEGRTFKAADMEPRALASILPSYLWVFRRHGQFAEPGSAA
ncbi:complex I NDUFA9 subunit family protein [Acuticoccus sp. MNP-M23]|uniref:complex I NDUFA9 subunit family protein n=1 Tax=Acuticoccus sp. MNP-M23 TaxID=3072793 RepID=UPI0028159044|nr:complex I NDUFA9 subunit family protein [Acuticoccus sp. MNP-M23]WMS43768.1 complex I NDUFA9 subunit family protein [Acuticoccus sp. MNP-M23]